MDKLRKLLNDLDTKAEEVKEVIYDIHSYDVTDDEDNLLGSIYNDIENLKYNITKYQEYKKWI